jgi:hypothetical protein
MWLGEMTRPIFSGVRVTRSLVLCACVVDHCRSLFVLLCFFLLAIVLSVRLRYTNSDCPFGYLRVQSLFYCSRLLLKLNIKTMVLQLSVRIRSNQAKKNLQSGKGVTRSCNSKTDRHYNGKTTKGITTGGQNTTRKTKD